MRRVFVTICVLGLFASTPGRNEDGCRAATPPSAEARETNGVISFCNDPNCVGCRSFLASYAAGEPNCCCDAMTADGAGTGAPGSSDGMGLGEDLLADDYGAGYGYETAAPNMIGDSLNGGGVLTHQGGTQASAVGLNSFHTFKIAEDESPWPKNRGYFDFNSYGNVPGTDEISRLMAGFERTFWDGQASIGFRLPIWSVDVEDRPTAFPAGTVVPFGSAGTHNAVGDLAITLKAKLAERSAGVLTSGLSFVLPTGPDTLGNVDPFYSMNNVSHRGALQPWLGWYRSAQSLDYGFFTQGFVAFDLPIDQDDADYLYLDLGTGYRVPRDGYITAITPMFEAHWSTPIADAAQTISLTPLGTARVGPGAGLLTSGVLGYRNQVNLTTALNFELANSMNLVVGFAIPTVGPQVMDYELIGQLNGFTW